MRESNRRMKGKPMKIWLVTIGEPLPLGISKDDRLHRTGQFARYCASKGHEVVWWTSTFDHFRKQHHFEGDKTMAHSRWLKIMLLRGCGYARNVSLGRLRDHRQLAEKFARAAEQMEVPDVIVAALPTIELCSACVDFGKRHAVPVVLDARDMWPDIFAEAVPRVAQPAARLLLRPLYKMAERACSEATAIIGITDAFVDWGVRRGKRGRRAFDRSFPIAYEATEPAPEKIGAADRFWDELGIYRDSPEMVVCYFGNVGVQLDLEHAVEGAWSLYRQGSRTRLVLCGSGERLEEYRKKSAGCPNVLFPGWVDGARIWSLMRRSHAGLDPLPCRYDFLATINNKAVEYLSAGLPVISSPQSGVLYELLRTESCGMSYDSGSAEGLLKRLETDGAMRTAMSSRSSSVFALRFSAEAVHAEMENYLADVVSDAHPLSRLMGQDEKELQLY